MLGAGSLSERRLPAAEPATRRALAGAAMTHIRLPVAGATADYRDTPTDTTRTLRSIVAVTAGAEIGVLRARSLRQPSLASADAADPGRQAFTGTFSYAAVRTAQA